MVKFGMLPQKVLHLHLEEKKKKPDINHYYMVTEKHDGIYAYIDYISGKWGNIHSRQCREIPAMRWAREEFIKLTPPLRDTRFIFEIIIPGLDFHTTGGILNRSKGNCQALEARILLHDCIYFSHNMEALTRWNNLLNFKYFTSIISTVELLTVSNNKEIWLHYFNQIIESDGEGIVLKRVDSFYQPDKRNSSLMKIKLEEVLYLECIETYTTIGEKGFDNLNLVLRRKSGVTLDVRVSKHKDIQAIQEEISYVRNKVVEVKCMCELESGKLREPRFVKVTDKKLCEIN